MVVNIFRREEKLQGSTNYNSWKARLTAILEENNLDDIVFNVNEEPTSNARRLAYKKKQTKARRIIYDFVKETMMPNITALRLLKNALTPWPTCMRRRIPVKRES